MEFIFLQQGVSAPKDAKGEIDVNPASILEKIDSFVDGFIKLLPNIGLAIVVLVASYFISKWLGKFVKKTLEKRGRSNFGEILGGFLRWTLLLVGIGMTMTIISPNLKFADLVAGLGVSSVAIGFAFKDILQNWMAGLLILMRQPFEIGDEISVNDITGVVNRIETRATIINRYDGQQVVIPNSQIYTMAVRVITSSEFIRSQYDIGVGYDQDYEKAQKVIKETLKGIEGINQDKGFDILPWDQADSWLNIRMRWWTESKRGTVVKVYSDVILKTQQAMNDAGIDLPFPTAVEVKNAHDVNEAQNFEKEKLAKVDGAKDDNEKKVKIDEDSEKEK